MSKHDDDDCDYNSDDDDDATGLNGQHFILQNTVDSRHGSVVDPGYTETRKTTIVKSRLDKTGIFHIINMLKIKAELAF